MEFNKFVSVMEPQTQMRITNYKENSNHTNLTTNHLWLPTTDVLPLNKTVHNKSKPIVKEKYFHVPRQIFHQIGYTYMNNRNHGIHK